MALGLSKIRKKVFTAPQARSSVALASPNENENADPHHRKRTQEPPMSTTTATTATTATPATTTTTTTATTTTVPRTTIWNWIESDDCFAVDAESNGFGRGDGYDIYYYRAASTGRYLVNVREVGARWSSWYVATTREGAKAIGAAGYTPGSAPGRYTYVCAPSRLREVRALHAQRRAATSDAR